MIREQCGTYIQPAITVIALLAFVIALLWATSPDPQGNTGSFESEPLVVSLAPLDQAVTLAQRVREDGSLATLWVTALRGDNVEVIDVSAALGNTDPNPLGVWGATTEALRTALLKQPDREPHRESEFNREIVPVTELIAIAPRGERHIGSGTNFPEHAKEASSTSVFQFPKFGKAHGPRTEVRWYDHVLLDYEVEFCLRFDRTIASLADYDAAIKGIFLCGDFTDRSALIRLVDPDNLDSGSGFSDGKSRRDFFPAGALLVVPNDLNAFLNNERMVTEVNGTLRQDARGGEMTLNFRALAEKALNDMTVARFLYKDQWYKLAPDGRLDTSMTLMSGTAEGVIFTPPSRADVIEGVMHWLLGGTAFRGESLIDHVIEVFIANELASGHFLQPGDVVVHRGSHLGDIVVQVVQPTDSESL